MIRLHVIQAKFGDCLLLTYGNEDSTNYMLIDGGPASVYENHLKPTLNSLMNGHTIIEDLIISHIDNDHITGVVDLLSELQLQQQSGSKPFLRIGELWFNSFVNTIGTTDFEKRTAKIKQSAGLNGVMMQEMSTAVNGFREGNLVMIRTGKLRIPVNTDAANGFYLASKHAQSIKKSNLEIIVVGPTTDNLTKLQTEWDKWITENERLIAQGKFTREVAAAMDRSIPNLSSIVLLIKADGKSILLTGDCRADHLQQGLIETGISLDGRLHVNIFKVPHHGSKRNCSKEFFEQVTADTYVISADGKYENPDVETLYWIVESANAAGRKVRLVFTNETPSTGLLLQKYKPDEFGYEVQFMAKDQHSIEVS